MFGFFVFFFNIPFDFFKQMPTTSKSDELTFTSRTTSDKEVDQVATDEPVMGVDLGTTFSCVCVWKNDKAVVVPNDQGNRTTPSIVAFTKFERLIGEPAKNQQEVNAENTIYNVKRLIGRKYEDAAVTAERQLLPYTIVNIKEKPSIKVECFGKTEIFSPEEISSMILKKLKSNAEKFLNCPIKNSVITVPEHFTNAQREATKLAGELAGLNVLAIMNEPTAAALAYGIDVKATDYKNVLVFDLGGGTFDVTLMSLGHQVLEVAKTQGNTRLGGEDFVTRLVDHCLIDIKKTLRDENSLMTDKESMQRLRIACETAKKALSNSVQHQIMLTGLFEGKPFQKKISRFHFDQLNKDLFAETLKTVENILEEANMDKKEIGAIVLVGGSTRILKIRQQLKTFFEVEQLNETIHPDEAVAIGAAIKAAHMTVSKSNLLSKFTISDVTTYSVGIKVGKKGIMNVLIPRNERIPFEKVHTVKTHKDYQENATIKVYEGESPMAEQNNFLGEFKLTNIAPAPKNEQKIEVEFKVKEGGILEAKATDKNSGSSANSILQITLLGSPTEIDIQRMILRMNRFDKIDAEKEEEFRTKNELGTMCNDLISIVDSEPNVSNYAEIFKECQDIQNWMETEEEIHPPTEYAKRLKKLKLRFNNVDQLQPPSKKLIEYCHLKGFDWFCSCCKTYNFAHLKNCSTCKQLKY